MFSNCGTGTVPKITRRNILHQRDTISNNISNNLEHIIMDLPAYTDASSKPSDSSDPTSSASNDGSNDTMSANFHPNQEKKSINADHQGKLDQIKEYLSITNSLICNMRKAEEQNDPTPDDSERLKQMVREFKDNEHKLLRILENWNQNAEIPLPEESDELELAPTISTVDEAVCLELQKPLVAEQENVSPQKLRGELDRNKMTCPDLYDNSRKNSANPVEAIQELEERLDSWNKTQLNRSNLQEHLESQVELLGDTISHLHGDSDTRKDIMDILDQKDSSLQAEHVSLQNKLLELQTKKQQVDQLVEQLHILNGHKTDDEDVGHQVRRIVSMKDQLSKLKDMLHSIQNMDSNEKSSTSEVASLCNTQVFTENIAPAAESVEATLRIRNDVRNSGRYLGSGLLQEEPNVHRHTQKQVNKKSTNAIDKQRSLQAELQAKKHELEELMSKRKATSNLNHDGNSEKSSVGMYNSLYNAYNHKDQYSSDEASDDETNDINTEMNLSVESLAKNQTPQSQSYLNQQHLIPERLASSISSSNRMKLPYDNSTSCQQASSSDWSIENRHQQLMDEERSQSEAKKAGIFLIDPNSYCKQPRGLGNEQQSAVRMQKIQLQEQLEIIRRVCDSMIMENAVASEQEDLFNSQLSHHHQQSLIATQHLRKNHTPSPLYSEPLSYNNTCATPDNQNINISQEQSNPLAAMSPIVTAISGGSSGKMGMVGTRGRMMDTSGCGGGGGDNEGIQAVQGSNVYNRNVKSCAPTNSDQATNMWQQQQWLVSNTLQSQAFIMNTLNQCCQMMWLQQREIQSLRNAVQNMQLQNQNNAPSANNQQRPTTTFNQFSNLQANPYSNSAFAYSLAGASLGQQLPPTRGSYPANADPTSCTGVKSNPNILGMLSNQSFPSSFTNSAPPMMGDSLDVNHTADFIASRPSNSAHVHRPNMTPMSDCLNNCSNNNLSNVNMNNVMPGGNNLAGNSNPQIWHERSLNNQVAQSGNRTNNYWDNFRR